MAVEAFFLPAADPGRGQRLCIHHRSVGAPRAAVVYLHPFAEEMNKSRRMAALQARALAAAGCAVLQIDLHGCGDSSGEFGDASWDDWLADAQLAAHWLQQRVDAPLWWWGLRGGALLAAQAAQRHGSPAHLLLWQPVTSGKLLLQQFLRLRTARDMLAGDAPGAAAALRRELAEGRAVDIAGYRLSPAVAAGLEAATLAPPAHAGRAVWVEVGAGGEPSPALATAQQRWAAAGWEVELHAVAGAPFWQTAEIETVPALLPLATRLLRQEAVVPA